MQETNPTPGDGREMTQDTRKDRRAKIVSLNVRYKSATVDEFIENHSHDVSRGGIFIKTPTPFPPGTLLKFEIRIAGDKAVIAGVGRVVWKREASQASGESPAGMGVKFIKLDDASRAVIDRLVDVKGADVGAAFESGNPDSPTLVSPPRPEAPPLAPKPVPAAVSRPPVPQVPAASPAPIPPLIPVERKPVGSPFAPSPSSQMAAQRADAAAGRKATIMGMGSTPAPPTAGDAAHATAKPAAGSPARAAGSPMFPKTDSMAEMPPAGEQTVMKQAAELLEEALKGAGGSIEEIGTNPLFERGMKAPAPNGPSPVEDSETEEKKRPENTADARSSPPPKPVESPKGETRTVSNPPRLAPEPAQNQAVPPTRGREPSTRPASLARSTSAAPRPVSATPAAEAPARGNRTVVAVFAAAAVGVVAYFGYTSFVEPPTESGAPATTTVPTQPPEPAISALPPPSATTSAEPASSASAAPAAAPSSSASPAASSAAAPSASSANPVVPPAVTTKPVAAPPPVATAKPPAPTATQAAPAPSSTDEGVATASAPKPPPPKPTWKAPPPKPKSEDDNPY
jgi:uncharacterized protein (TIGR02266 family)